MKVTVIGGGAVGLSCAYYLQQAGAQVSVLDKNDFSDNCSYGNAGLIAPSHIIPLASPGMISKGLSYALSSKSPFYIKPQLKLDLYNWAWRFYRSATEQHVEKAMYAIRDINCMSRDLYKEMSESKELSFEYSNNGLLQIYKTEKGKATELSQAEKANSIGVEANEVSPVEIAQLAGLDEINAIGAVHYPGDAHIYPDKFMRNLKSFLEKAGVQFHPTSEVQDFVFKNSRVRKIITKKGELEAEYVVLASGAWSAGLARKLNIRLLVQDGKGYSITQKKAPLKPQIPAVLSEAKVAVTPMGDDLRLGGTLEFSGFSILKRPKRIQAILDAVPDYYPQIKVAMPELETVWYGYRPCSHDGLPYIGATVKYENLVIATGHSMMGLSMAPATGKLVSEILYGKNLSIDIKPFSPERV